MEEYGKYSSIDYYRLPKREVQLSVKISRVFKICFREFDCKEEIIKDKEIADIVCVKCARMLRKKYAGFLMGSGFISLLAFVRSMVI